MTKEIKNTVLPHETAIFSEFRKPQKTFEAYSDDFFVTESLLIKKLVFLNQWLIKNTYKSVNGFIDSVENLIDLIIANGSPTYLKTDIEVNGTITTFESKKSVELIHDFCDKILNNQVMNESAIEDVKTDKSKLIDKLIEINPVTILYHYQDKVTDFRNVVGKMLHKILSSDGNFTAVDKDNEHQIFFNDKCYPFDTSESMDLIAKYLEKKL